MPRLRIFYSRDAFGYARRVFGWLCIGGAAACFAYGLSSWLEQRQYQAEAAEAFEELRIAEEHPPASATRKSRAPVMVISPFAKLEIERLGVSGYVEDGLDSATLGRAIGHWPQSAKLGHKGNIVLAAHRDSFFSGLKDVKVGDVVTLRSPHQKLFQYRVKQFFVVDPSSTWVMNPTPEQDMLTLITCFPFRFAGSAPKRFVVQAEPLIPSATAFRTSF